MTMTRRPPGPAPVPLRDMFDRWFRDPWFGFPAQFDGDGSLAVDVREQDDKYVIEADMPGIRPEDTEVTLDGRTLTIRASYDSGSDDDAGRRQGDYLVRERRRGSLTRTVTLPTEVDADHVTSTYENGELCITMPKAAQARARRIDVTPRSTGG